MAEAPSLEQIEEAYMLDDSIGFCRACGEEATGVEPDAEKYECDSCGKHRVDGLDVWLYNRTMTPVTPLRREKPKKELPLYNGERPLFTNASINREAAMDAHKGGMTLEQIAATWPKVFFLNDEGKLGQKYDYRFKCGTLESKTIITSSSVKAAIAKYKS